MLRAAQEGESVLVLTLRIGIGGLHRHPFGGGGGEGELHAPGQGFGDVGILPGGHVVVDQVFEAVAKVGDTQGEAIAEEDLLRAELPPLAPLRLQLL